MFKWFLSRLIIAFLVIVVLSILSIFIGSHLVNHSGLAHHSHDFFEQARMPLTIVRVLFYIGFYFAWPKIIERRAKRQHWPAENIPKAIRLRYPITLFFLFLETMNQVSQLF